MVDNDFLMPLQTTSQNLTPFSNRWESHITDIPDYYVAYFKPLKISQIILEVINNIPIH